MVTIILSTCQLTRLEMVTLSKLHPVIYDSITNDHEWVVQQNDGYGFSAIACDHVIEQMVNRDSKPLETYCCGPGFGGDK